MWGEIQHGIRNGTTPTVRRSKQPSKRAALLHERRPRQTSRKAQPPRFPVASHENGSMHGDRRLGRIPPEGQRGRQACPGRKLERSDAPRLPNVREVGYVLSQGPTILGAWCPEHHLYGSQDLGEARSDVIGGGRDRLPLSVLRVFATHLGRPC